MCDGFYENCLYNGFFIDIVNMWWFFIHIVYFRIIFSMKRGYVYVWEACEFCGCAFLISEKSDEQKIAPEILRFASMLFNVIINVSIF